MFENKLNKITVKLYNSRKRVKIKGSSNTLNNYHQNLDAAKNKIKILKSIIIVTYNN